MDTNPHIELVISIMENLYKEESLPNEQIAKLRTETVRPYINRLCQLEQMHHTHPSNSIIVEEYARIAEGIAFHVRFDDDLPPLEDKRIGKIVRAI